MYFGDTDLFMATSDDLIQWEPVLDEQGKFKSVLKPRLACLIAGWWKVGLMLY